MESTDGNAIRKDEIAKLLRYESTDFGAGELTSLEEYIERMKEDQRYIFYLPVKNRQQALSRYFLIDERFQISLVTKILDNISPKIYLLTFLPKISDFRSHKKITEIFIKFSFEQSFYFH